MRNKYGHFDDFAYFLHFTYHFLCFFPIVKTGPSMAETALGRLSQGTKLLTEGGLDKVFKQNFETLPEEELRMTYACFLSTSSGPIPGTLYISTKKIAFCSDRPLSYQQESGQTASIYYKVRHFKSSSFSCNNC